MSALQTQVKEKLEKFKRHLTGVVLPAWMDQGWDDRFGGYHERLQNGQPVDLGYKRLTATARQLFVFSEWSKRTEQDAYAKMAHKTYDYLMSHFWDASSGGWAAKVDRQGKISDTTHDLYSTAFAIFALARYGKVFKKPEAIQKARRTMEIVDERMRHPLAGYVTAADRDWKPLTLDLDQNPHMHLLEALQVLNDAENDPVTIAFEDQVVRLMSEVLYDKELGVLREFFDKDGKPHAEKGGVVEPGHQFEWYWLVRGGAQRSYGFGLNQAVDRMFTWGLEHGIDREKGMIFDVCDIQGKVTQTTKRIWPSAEFLRAAACRWKKEGDEKALTLMNDQLSIFLASFLSPQGWNESLDQQLKPTRADMPATTSYHLTTSYLDSADMLGF